MIRVLPGDQANGATLVADGAADPLAWANRRSFTASGRAGLDAVLGSLGLEQSDDVLVTNTSGQTYVSACVTCIVFNHCRPSRVLTDRTRAIVVIHEFGYPHPELGVLLAVARERGIPLIEDCAHSFDSRVADGPLGSFGDYAIFSLPKVMPAERGGILVGPLEIANDVEAEHEYLAALPSLAEFARRRRLNHDAVRGRFPDLPVLLEASPGVTPFYVCLVIPDALEVRRRSDAIEWGKTLRDDLLLITTNPFVEPAELVDALASALEQT
jgi:hypothetical protein